METSIREKEAAAPFSNKKTSTSHRLTNITKDVQSFPTFSWLEVVYRITMVKVLENCYGRVIYW